MKLGMRIQLTTIYTLDAAISMILWKCLSGECVSSLGRFFRPLAAISQLIMLATLLSFPRNRSRRSGICLTESASGGAGIHADGKVLFRTSLLFVPRTLPYYTPPRHALNPARAVALSGTPALMIELSGFIRMKSKLLMKSLRISNCFRNTGPPPPGALILAVPSS